MPLDSYVTLGKSGLKVSPLCLGTMTFGNDWGWGADEAASRAMFDRYREKGGNFIDTADLYTQGTSEQFVGAFIADTKSRDRVVLATKFSFNAEPGNPNAGGNGRKNIYRALEGSLKRLKTDYVDLYWLHVWDLVTPVDEVLSTMDALVRAGKVRHFGLSDVPAWYAAQAQTRAEAQGWERIVALQLEYSLVERSIEREHIPAAAQLGLGVCPWSPLGGGFLSGKYRRAAGDNKPAGRLDGAWSAMFERVKTEKNQGILDALIAVAAELGRSPAEVALNWVNTRPGITSTIIGVTSLTQLDSNLSALDFAIPAELGARLDAASRLDSINPYRFFEPDTQARVNGGTTVRGWRES
jgi:aryl-alcohol dehydrogenase-like predicted oxidoreductase